MADTSILFQGRQLDTATPLDRYQNALMQVQNLNIGQQALQGQALQNQLLQSNIEQRQGEARRQASAEELQKLAQLNRTIGPMLQGQTPNLLGAYKTVEKLAPALGFDAEDLQEFDMALRTSEGRNALINAMSQADRLVTAQSKPVSTQKGRTVLVDTPEGPAFATNVFNPATGETQTSLTSIGGDLVSTLGETAAQQSERKVKTEGEVEAAKLASRLKLEPEVKAAVASAVKNVQAVSDQQGETRDNAKALEVYEVAVNGLTESLGGTTTGPIAGWLPAMSANQQIADGAVAAMAPVMKQMFRSAGEGTFTDSDQKILLEMIPTRKDRPEARVAKLKNIDAIVRAKLSASNAVGDQVQNDTVIPASGELQAPQSATQNGSFTTQSGITFRVK